MYSVSTVAVMLWAGLAILVAKWVDIYHRSSVVMVVYYLLVAFSMMFISRGVDRLLLHRFRGRSEPKQRVRLKFLQMGCPVKKEVVRYIHRCTRKE